MPDDRESDDELKAMAHSILEHASRDSPGDDRVSVDYEFVRIAKRLASRIILDLNAKEKTSHKISANA